MATAVMALMATHMDTLDTDTLDIQATLMAATELVSMPQISLHQIWPFQHRWQDLRLLGIPCTQDFIEALSCKIHKTNKIKKEVSKRSRKFDKNDMDHLQFI